MTTIISQCIYCRHLRMPEYTCPAFPNSIPEAVLSNRRDRREPIQGDHGVRWEPGEPGDQHPGRGITSTFTPGR